MNWRWWVAAFAAVLVVGVVAANNQPTPPPPTTTTSTTTTSAPPISATQVWNVPVASITRDSRSDDWVRRLLLPGQPTITWFGLSTDGQDYSVPVVDARTANRTIRMYRKANFPGGFTVASGTAVPWNDAWRPALSNDANMVISNPDTGETIDLFNVSWPAYSTAYDQSFGCINLDNLLLGFDINQDACAASYYRIETPNGKPVDIRTYAGNAPGSSGSGIQGLPMAVTPQEVAAGRIGHALKLYVPNSMFGLECSPQDRTDPAQFGVTCSGAVAPGGQFEGKNQAYSPGGGAWSRPPTDNVPEGTRYSLVMSDPEIQTWLDSRGYTGQLRETARIFAVGLREYGAFVGDTDGYGIGIPMVSDPAGWRNLGIAGTGNDLLAGLFTADHLQSLTPPTNLCFDGSVSRWYCWASESRYP